MKRRTFFEVSTLFGLGLSLPVKAAFPECTPTQPKVIEPINLGEQYCEAPEQFTIEVIDYTLTIQPDTSIIISGRGWNENNVVKYFKVHIPNSKFNKFEECPDIEIEGRYTKLLKIEEKPLYEQNNVDCMFVPMIKKHIVTLTCKSY